MKDFTRSFFVCLLLSLVSTAILAQHHGVSGSVADTHRQDPLLGEAALAKYIINKEALWGLTPSEMIR
ncbi:hypothetical protein BFP72_04330 [Reichenbachiella sp. 5M10]|uniref:hypothetical protein n=1 Tax=Reichenbachiella sp. 5M10 TaxID=1889772 RepID=UPI000C15B832|nr:hypothetical protein [Reichenbachiella sp. 5M10]PIB34689.1 hypothetical protein BFP72_04330 [Reichenbachiella sp. 5M10]